MMKNKIVIGWIVLCLCSSCKQVKENHASDEAKPPVQVVPTPEIMAEALYQDLEGAPINIGDYKGKRLLLNYWATWCKPCIEEMPAMARAQEILKDENYVFLFASDQSFEKIKAFKEQRKFGLNFIKFNGNYADLQITALPVTLLYNEEGVQVKRILGGVEWDAPEMIEILKLLK